MRLSVLIAARRGVLFPAMDMQAQTASGQTRCSVAYFSHIAATRAKWRGRCRGYERGSFRDRPSERLPCAIRCRYGPGQARDRPGIPARAEGAPARHRRIRRGFRRLRPAGGAPSRRPWRRSLPRTTGRERRCAVHDARGQPHGPQRGRHRKALYPGATLLGGAAGARQCRERLAVMPSVNGIGGMNLSK